MKIVAAALLLLSAAPVLAQDQLSTEKPAATTPATTPAAQPKAVQRPPKPPEGVTYSGFLVDLARAENKKKLLSLRQPADPKNDFKNVYLNERSGRVKGYVLFSLDF